MPDNTYYGAGTYGEGNYQPYVIGPNGIGEGGTVGTPAAAATVTATPIGITDGQQFPGTITAGTASSITPTGIGEGGSIGTPALAQTISAGPAGISDPQDIGAPALGSNYDNPIYGQGTYGTGIYFGQGLPTDQSAAPMGIRDGETAGNPASAFTQAINGNEKYGAGIYGEGIYFGQAPAIKPPGSEPAAPLMPPAITIREMPQHILGIGPRTADADWRGAPNYGLPKGRSRVARPYIPLPRATSLSITMRLNESSEARAEFTFARDQAIIPEAMLMELWWRRKDPHTGLVEMLGRFNTSSCDVQGGDQGIQVSANFVDYRTLLNERMVLRYLDATYNTTMWDKNTPIVEILRWAVPANAGLNLSALDSTDPYGLGNTIRPFEIPLGTTMAEVFTNLATISAKPWEWWIDDTGTLPALRFQLGARGRDRNVVLADVGGPSPITSWTMSESGEKYANTLYFVGADGGDVVQLSADVARYGQHDASDSDSSVKATKDKDTGLPYLLDRAAQKRLAALADRKPTFTIQLRPGWWRGRSHLDIGDTVSIAIRLGQDVITAENRVTELTLAIDDTGTEQVSLTLGPPPVSGNPRSRRSALARIIARLKNFERKDTGS